jgi:5-methylcytosine-specific restriction endonuclease McrA
MASRTRKPLSASTRFAVWRRDGFCCTYCGRSGIDDQITLEVDHILAVVDGGSDDFKNLTTACKACNTNKGPRGRRRPIALQTRRRQISLNLEDDLYEVLASVAKARRTSIAQVAREYIATGVERDRRIEQLAQAAEVA